MPTQTLPAPIERLLAMSENQQMDLANPVYWFGDHDEKMALIADYFRTRNDFYIQSVTVHGYSSLSGVNWTYTGVAVTDDFRVLMKSSAQWIVGAYVVHDHDVITRIELPDGTCLTGKGPRDPWRPALECGCNYCTR